MCHGTPYKVMRLDIFEQKKRHPFVDVSSVLRRFLESSFSNGGQCPPYRTSFLESCLKGNYSVSF